MKKKRLNIIHYKNILILKIFKLKKKKKKFIYTPDIRDFKLALIFFAIIYFVRVNSVKYIFMKRAEKTVIDFPSKEYRQKKVFKVII